MKKVMIIGAGLAGSEAAWQLLKRGFDVKMIEMRPKTSTPAHATGLFGELVCSNSLRADDHDTSAIGLLHEEMRQCDSLIMKCADACKVPAGGALAVNRDDFAKMVTDTLINHPHFSLHIQEADLPVESDIPVILATGPLTSDRLAHQLQAVTGTESLHFFDAIAPIVYTDSIDMSKAWFQSRYDKGDGTDYLNCPMNEVEYNAFIDALLVGDKVQFKDWEQNTPYFEGCLPIEVMAERGRQTLLFGPMKPVGLRNPHQDFKRAFAVVQLRKENKDGTLMNLVGFQTKLTYGAQKQIFKMIPGLETAEFARLGGIHRNTFVCGPKVMDEHLCLKNMPHIRLAGQITGCEGYVESASVGLLAGLFTAISQMPLPPRETALGAMLAHITSQATDELFQPMNINFGLFPPVQTHDGKRKIKGADKKRLYTDRAKASLKDWLKNIKT